MKKKIKNIVILGSTGSIGVSSLDVISRLKNQFRVVGLAANKNVPLIYKQIKKYSPDVVALDDDLTVIVLAHPENKFGQGINPRTVEKLERTDIQGQGR